MRSGFRIDVLHVNDQIVEICGVSVRGKTVKDAVTMLQNAKGSVQLKICRKFDYRKHQESGISSMKHDSTTGANDNMSCSSASASADNSRQNTPHKKSSSDNSHHYSELSHCLPAALPPPPPVRNLWLLFLGSFPFFKSPCL